MKGLYRGKYIIAFYDEEGYLSDVGCTPEELNRYRTKNIADTNISHIFNARRPSKKCFFIDVTEEHDDVFAEEDKLFLEFVDATRKRTKTELAKELGLPVRYYNKLFKNKNKNIKGVQNYD